MNTRLNIIIILIAILIGSLGAYAYWNRPPVVKKDTTPIIVIPPVKPE